MGAIQNYFIKKAGSEKGTEVRAIAAKEAFEAMMEGAALMLDFVGHPIEYTYHTKSGNKVHVLMDSP